MACVYVGLHEVMRYSERAIESVASSIDLRSMQQLGVRVLQSMVTEA